MKTLHLVTQANVPGGVDTFLLSIIPYLSHHFSIILHINASHPLLFKYHEMECKNTKILPYSIDESRLALFPKFLYPFLSFFFLIRSFSCFYSRFSGSSNTCLLLCTGGIPSSSVLSVVPFSFKLGSSGYNPVIINFHSLCHKRTLLQLPVFLVHDILLSCFSDFILTVSNASMNSLNKFTYKYLLPKNQFILPHGINSKYTTSRPSQELHDSRFNARKLVAFNPYSSFKDPYFLLDFFTNFKSLSPDTSLHLYGSYTREEFMSVNNYAVALGIRDSVFMHSYINNPVEILDTSTFLVITTDPKVGESFSYSALEALSIGLPIISRITGAISDLVVDNVSGVTSVCPYDLARKAHKIASSIDSYRVMSRNAYKKYSSRYRLSDTSESFIDFIDHVFQY